MHPHDFHVRIVVLFSLDPMPKHIPSQSKSHSCTYVTIHHGDHPKVCVLITKNQKNNMLLRFSVYE